MPRTYYRIATQHTFCESELGVGFQQTSSLGLPASFDSHSIGQNLTQPYGFHWAPQNAGPSAGQWRLAFNVSVANSNLTLTRIKSSLWQFTSCTGTTEVLFDDVVSISFGTTGEKISTHTGIAATIGDATYYIQYYITNAATMSSQAATLSVKATIPVPGNDPFGASMIRPFSAIHRSSRW